jgi:hypothetical protein
MQSCCCIVIVHEFDDIDVNKVNNLSNYYLAWRSICVGIKNSFD